jgi:hypothetical protein
MVTCDEGWRFEEHILEVPYRCAKGLEVCTLLSNESVALLNGDEASFFEALPCELYGLPLLRQRWG